MELKEVVHSDNAGFSGLWGEGVVGCCMGEFLGAFDLVLGVAQTCRRWRSSLKAAHLWPLWTKFAITDTEKMLGPFGEPDAKSVGLIVSRSLSHFAFNEKRVSDLDLWHSKEAPCWVLRPNCERALQQLYFRFYGQLQDATRLATEFDKPVERLQHSASKQWVKWMGTGRHVVRVTTTALILFQTVLLSFVLDRKYMVLQSDDGSKWWNELAPKPVPCNDWALCTPWTLLLLPLWILVLLNPLLIVWVARPYCLKSYLRARFSSKFRFAADLRKVTIAEFQHDHSALDNNPNHNGNDDVLDEDERQLRDLMALGGLSGYRLISKLLLVELCCLFFVSLGLWYDAWWPKPMWTLSLWIYPCPMIPFWVFPRRQWRNRLIQLLLFAFLWFGMAVFTTCQMAQLLSYSGTWVYFVLMMPLGIILTLISEGDCAQASLQQEPDPAKERREAASIFLTVAAMISFWTSGILISGRIDAYMRFSWFVAATPLLAAVSLFAAAALFAQQ